MKIDAAMLFGSQLKESCFRDAQIEPLKEYSYRNKNDFRKCKGSNACRLSGIFVDEHIEVPLVVIIPSDFRKHPPRVYVKLYEAIVDERSKLPHFRKRINGWVRLSKDWHCGKNGALCWVLHKEWEHIHGSSEKPLSLVIEDGTLMLHKDVGVLLRRHKIGHIEKRKKWPKEWSEWRHYEDGIEQFREEMRIHGQPHNWSEIKNVA